MERDAATGAEAGPPGETGEWARGWTVVLAAIAGFSFFSILISSSGLFFGPLEKAFGWDRSTLAAGPAIATAVTALLSPFYGAVIDRYGSRRLGVPGVVVTILAMCTFSLADGSKAQWIAMWVIFGLVLTTIKSTIWTSAVAGMFTRGRGLALGLAVTGPAIAQTVVPPLGNWLIETQGWRAAIVWLALGWGGVTLLLAWLFLYDAHDLARRKARRGVGTSATRPLATGPTEPSSARVERVRLAGLSRREALRDTGLIQTTVSSFVVMTMTIGLAIHLFPILTENGVSRDNAAWLMATGGIAGILGKLTTGWLLDRYRPNWTGAVTMGVTAVTFVLLIGYLHSMPMLIAAILINGYAAGSKTQITAYLTAGYAGLRNFGLIYGAISAVVALSSGLGPWLGGVIYDATGGYTAFLWAGAVACALGGAILLFLPPMPKWEEPGPA